MEHKNIDLIQARVSGSREFTFNIPEVGDRVILLHNPFNNLDSNNIMIFNSELQRIGHLTHVAGFNKEIGNLIDWKPYVASVISVSPNFSEIFIEIKLNTINQKKEDITNINDVNYSLN